MPSYLAILVWTLLMVLTPELHATNFRALLIGINYQGADASIRPLQGAVADVNAMHSLMTGTLKIPPAAIHTLIEGQATRAGILQYIRDWLITGTNPGDSVFIMYAGHGTQVPDTLGKQTLDPDKYQDQGTHQSSDVFGDANTGLQLAEALVPYDTQLDTDNKTATNLILDRELYQLLLELRDRQVTLWLDHCNSGGMTRGGISNRFRPRNLALPWAVADTTSVNGISTRQYRGVKGIRISTPRADTPYWPYRYFAAARYYQAAAEDGTRGVFTKALTELLTANPQAHYTNSQIIAATSNVIQYQHHIPPESQKPVFYGPTGTDTEIFPLLGQTPPEPVIVAPPEPVVVVPPEPVVVAPPAPNTPPTLPVITQTRIDVQGTSALAETIRLAINQHPQQLVVDQLQADLVLQITGQVVSLYHPTGQLLQQFAADPGLIINALLAYQTGQQLGNIHNLAAPLQVELWLDNPGQTTFQRNARVTLYYRVHALPYSKAYLTLLNLSPDGTLSVLYPQPQRTALRAGGRQLYLSAEVQPGRIHTIPKGREALQPGENTAIDMRLRLTQAGNEYFKAIVTPQPLDLSEIDADFATRLKRGVGGIARNSLPTGWGAGDLRVVVE